MHCIIFIIFGKLEGLIYCKGVLYVKDLDWWFFCLKCVATVEDQRVNLYSNYKIIKKINSAHLLYEMFLISRKYTPISSTHIQMFHYLDATLYLQIYIWRC